MEVRNNINPNTMASRKALRKKEGGSAKLSAGYSGLKRRTEGKGARGSKGALENGEK
jgi:hypothetical protein